METYLAEIIYTFLYVILCKMFVESFAKRKSEILIWTMWIFILILTILDYLVSVFFADHFLVKQIIVILLGTTIMWRFYRLRFLKCSLIILFYQGLCFAADYFAWMALQKLIIITLVETRMLKFLMGTLSQLLVFCVIIVLRHYFVQEEKEKITDIEWIKFSLFPIFTILAIMAMLINFNGLSNKKQINTLICLAFGMLILNIFTVYLLWGAIEREVKIRKERLYAERAKSQTEIYRQISENFDQQKKREHEYKNELMIISSLLKQNEIEKLKSMLNKYNDEIANRVDIIDTNHIIVNAILNTKYQEAREKGIVFVLKVNDLSQLNMEDQDIVVILTNMLNNAIEACEKCTGKKIIRVKAIKENKKVIFSVSNTFQKIPHFVNGKYITTKKEPFHGMGIENVKGIVGKYHGTCAIRYDKEQFYFVVYLSE